MYIIPSIYIRDGKTVALATGGTIFDADPVAMAKKLAHAGAEIVHIVDLNMPAVGNIPNLGAIGRIIKEAGMKVQVAGNVRSVEIVEHYMSAGAERIVLGAIAYQKPDFLKACCAKFPKKVAAHIEVRGGKVVITGWTVAAKKTALDYAAQFKEAGVSIILYSDVEKEGRITPADIKHIMEFSWKSPIPIIHATDISAPPELDLVLGLESGRIIGTIFGKSMYAGIMDIAITITHEKDKMPAGMDEPTLIPE